MHPQIEWHAAQSVSQYVTAEKLQSQIDKQTEFKESNAELFDANDLQYYIDETGKDLQWLLANATNLNPVLSSALSMGATLDDCLNIDVHASNDDCNEDDPDLVTRGGR